MYSVYSYPTFSTHDFPQPILDNQKISNKLKALIKVLKDQFESICHNAEEGSAISPFLMTKVILMQYSKEELIKKMAASAFFVEQEITYEKTCTGHEFYITHRSKSHGKINKLIRKYSKWIIEQEGVISEKTYGWEEKQNDGSYLAKFKVFHVDNCSSCNSKSHQVVTSQKVVSVLEELLKIESFLNDQKYTVSSIYSTIYEKVTELKD